MHNAETSKKEEITKAVMTIEYTPSIPDVAKEKPCKAVIPWTEIKALGTSFQPLTSIVQTVLTGKGGSGIYFVNTHGKTMFNFKNSNKYFSALKKPDGSVGGGQAELTQLLCDPTMFFVAATLANIEKKLDEIKESQAEMMDFIVQKDKSEQRGDLNFLSEILNNYKFNWDNEKYKSANHIKALDIKRSSESKIHFYRELIKTKLAKRSSYHSDKDVEEMLEYIETNFVEYQLALYLFSFSSFLEIILLENYDQDFLNGIKEKIENYSLLYRELYTECYNQMEEYSKTSIQSFFLGKLASLNSTMGKGISKIPIIKESQIDENLISAGERIGEISGSKTKSTMLSFVKKQYSYIHPFIENIIMINEIYNQPMGLYFDKEKLYLYQI